MKTILAPLLVSLGVFFSSPLTSLGEKPEKRAKLEKLEEDDGSRDGRKIRDKSPDGRYALLITYREDKFGDPNDLAQLVEIESQKILATFNDADSQFNNGSETKLLWSPDSLRVAFYWGHRRGGFTDVFQRAGAGFKKVKLPEFPDLPDEPSKAFVKKHHWTFSRVMIAHDESPVKWLKSGALVIEASSSAGGEAGVWTRSHTLTIGFDAKGKATLEKVVKEEKLD